MVDLTLLVMAVSNDEGAPPDLPAERRAGLFLAGDITSIFDIDRAMDHTQGNLSFCVFHVTGCPGTKMEAEDWLMEQYRDEPILGPDGPEPGTLINQRIRYIDGALLSSEDMRSLQSGQPVEMDWFTLTGTDDFSLAPGGSMLDRSV